MVESFPKERNLEAERKTPFGMRFISFLSDIKRKAVFLVTCVNFEGEGRGALKVNQNQPNTGYINLKGATGHSVK